MEVEVAGQTAHAPSHAPGQSHAGKYLTFALATEEYGLPVLKVREIIGLMEITRVPRTEPFVLGVLSLRGTLSYVRGRDRDNDDNLYRIVDATYSYQDMTQGTLDAYLSSINNRLNETMKRLTVLTVVLASLTVITGVYGMNFQHMPELGWIVGYPLAIAFMVAVDVVLYQRFRRAGWL